MFRKTLFALSALLLAGQTLAHADVLDDIKKRGTLIVGTKADYRPFGFRDPSGAIIGVEPDLAGLVAQKLGVKVEIVPVVSSNRMEFLQQGKIDILMATMSVTPERQKVVTIIEPFYYADFVNIMLRKDSPVKSWEDLKGKKVCGTTGAWYNRPVTEKYAPEITSFDGSEKPLLALRNGDCAGYLYDQTFIVGKMLDPDWNKEFAMPLPGILEAPWGIAVKNGEDALKKLMEETTIEWMKTGAIIALEKKWGVPPTAYSERMFAKYKVN